MTHLHSTRALSQKIDEEKPPSRPRYRLEHAGRLFELESRDVGFGYVARLFVDGELRDEQKAQSERTELRADGRSVKVKWGDFGGIKRCDLIAIDAEGKTLKMPLEPPSGSHAARIAEFGRKRPVLYATRHIAKPVLQALLPLLGIGALLTALLPHIDWGWVPAFIRTFFRGDGPGWLEPIVQSPIVRVGKWVLPIVLGLLIAVDELEKHNKRETALRKEDRGTHR